MQDKIQLFANRFCAAFGLAPTTIVFAVAFDRRTMNIYNFLLTPKSILSSTEQRWNEKMEELAKQGRHDLVKDYLEREIAESTALKSFVSEIEAKDIAVLRAAIDICNGNRTTVKLDPESAKNARDVAERIRRFHAKGKAIQLFKDLLDTARNERGKCP